MKFTACLLVMLAAAVLMSRDATGEKLQVELSEAPLSSMKGFDRILKGYQRDFVKALQTEEGATIETIKKRVDAEPFLHVQEQRIVRQQNRFARALHELSNGAWEVEYLTDESTGERSPAATNIITNIVTVDIGDADVRSAIGAIRGMHGVRDVRPAAHKEPKMFEVVKQINADKVWADLGISDVTAGKGVKIAFVDEGIDANHTMMSGDGIEYLNISYTGVPNSDNNVNNKVAASRTYGVRYSYPSIYGDHHGIAVSSIATGRPATVTMDGTQYNISGVAPGAWVFNYLGNDNMALEQTITDKVDIVNVAWGFDVSAFYNSYYTWYKIFLQISRNGAVLVKSAGDEGPGTLTSDHVGSAAGGIVVGAATKTAVTTSYLVITDKEGTTYKFPFTHTYPTGIIRRSEYTLNNLDDDEFLSCEVSDLHTFSEEDAVLALPPSNCTMEYLAQHIKTNIGLMIFAPNGEYTNDPEAYTTPFVVISHVDGNAIRELILNHTEEKLTAKIVAETAAPKYADAVAEFSSRGPSVEMSLVPHVIAPGANVLAAGYGEVPDPRLGYSFQSGSSMATAVVSGAAAILRQQKPNFTNAEIKSALMSTAEYVSIVREEDGKPANVLDMGAGRIDLEKALKPHLFLNPPLVDFSLVPRNMSSSVYVNVSSYDKEVTHIKVHLMQKNSEGKMVEVNTTATPFIQVDPVSFDIKADDAQPTQLRFVARHFHESLYGDHSVYAVFKNDDNDQELAHIPIWGQAVCNEAEKKDVFLITLDSLKCANDSSSRRPVEDLRKFYEKALYAAGLTYETFEYCDDKGPITLPNNVMSLCFRTVIIASGTDYGYPLNNIENELRRLMHAGVPVIQMGANSALNWGPIGEMSYGSRWIFQLEFGFNTPPNSGWKPDNYVQITKIDRYPLIETRVPRIYEDDYDWQTHVIFRDARGHPLVFLFRDQPQINMVRQVFGSTGVTSFVGVEELANQIEDAPRFIKDIFLAATETNTSDISVAYKFENSDDGYAKLSVSVSTKSVDRMISSVEIFWNDVGDEVTVYNESFYSKKFVHKYNTSRSITPFILVTSAYQNHFAYPLGTYEFTIKSKNFFMKNFYYFLGAIIVLAVIIIFTIITVVIKVAKSRAKSNAYKNLQEDLIDNEDEK